MGGASFIGGAACPLIRISAKEEYPRITTAVIHSGMVTFTGFHIRGRAAMQVAASERRKARGRLFLNTNIPDSQTKRRIKGRERCLGNLPGVSTAARNVAVSTTR